MNRETTLIVTSIHAPNTAMRALAGGCEAHGWKMIVAGDTKSPADFNLAGCRFLSTDAQRELGFALGALAPERSYTRKNLGYLAAMADGARVLVETDDDNHPRESFWQTREESVDCRHVETRDWVNAYRYFTDHFIYPRGLPLVVARCGVPDAVRTATVTCPIQQGLADEDPDVDAVYRMLHPLPFRFSPDASPVMLGPGAWCPFNSQNTTFFESVLPLMYLPAHCSFRMTDIWRSFVAQRVLHARGRGVLFHGPTVWQERNEHDLMRDFQEETVGYLHNAAIRETLEATPLPASMGVRTQVETCYQQMIRNGWIGADEELLLQAWFNDLEAIGIPS